MYSMYCVHIEITNLKFGGNGLKKYQQMVLVNLYTIAENRYNVDVKEW